MDERRSPTATEVISSLLAGAMFWAGSYYAKAFSRSAANAIVKTGKSMGSLFKKVISKVKSVYKKSPIGKYFRGKRLKRIKQNRTGKKAGKSKEINTTGRNHDIFINGYNPFKGKTFRDIDKILTKKGFIKKGKDPLNGKGMYINPKTGRGYYFDKGGVYANGFEPPHIDVFIKGTKGKKWKYMLDGPIWKPKKL